MARLPMAGMRPRLVAGMHRHARMLLLRRVALQLAALTAVAVVAACSGSDGEPADVSSGPSPVAPPASPPAPSPTGCSAVVAGLPSSVAAQAAQYPFSITIGSSCEWTVQSDAKWADVSPGSGRGNATLMLKVEMNTRPDDTRTAVVTVNSVPYRVLQNRRSCAYAIDRTRIDQDAGGGNVRINLTTEELCPWTATASERWIRVVTSSGLGSAQVSVDIESNSSAERSGYLTIAGLRVDVVQRR